MTIIPIQVEPIKEEGYHAFINITVHGHSVKMLLDTGASRTVFDSQTLRNLYAGILLEENEDKATGLGSNKVDNYIGTLKEITIGDILIEEYQVGVLDLTHVNESYSSLNIPAIAGVLGSDILLKYKAIIDFGKNELWLYPQPH